MTTQNAQTGPVAPEERPPAPPGAAGERLAELPNPAQIDALLADAEAIGISIDGRNGLINRMVKAVLERGLDVEMADHLGYDRGDRAGRAAGTPATGSPPRSSSPASAGRDRGAAGPQRQLRPSAGAEAETPPRFERRHDLEPLCPWHHDP